MRRLVLALLCVAGCKLGRWRHRRGPTTHGNAPPDGPAGKAILGLMMKRRCWNSITDGGVFDSNFTDYGIQRFTIANRDHMSAVGDKQSKAAVLEFLTS